MNTTPTMWPARPYIGQMMIKLLRDNMMIDDHHMMIDMMIIIRGWDDEQTLPEWHAF